MDDVERAAIREEGYDPDDPKVIAALDRVRAEIETIDADLRLVSRALARGPCVEPHSAGNRP